MKDIRQIRVSINENKLSKLKDEKLSHLINDLLDIYITERDGKSSTYNRMKQKIQKGFYLKDEEYV